MGKTDNKFGDQFDSISMENIQQFVSTTGTAGLVGSVPGICDINIIGMPPDKSEESCRSFHPTSCHENYNNVASTLPKFHMGTENGTLEWKIHF